MLPVKSNLLPIVSGFFEDDWNNLFDWSNRNLTATVPAVNIQEKPDQFIIEMAAPGMKKEDFQIELHKSILTIKNDHKSENSITEENYYRQEYNFHSFKRSFNLKDKAVDNTNIVAKYHNGVLKITIPKKEEIKQKPAKVISIS